MEIAANGTLARVWGLLEPYSRTYITSPCRARTDRRIAGLHVPVLDALRSRDAATAEAAIRHHFADAEVMLAGLWTDPEPGETEPRPERAAPGAQAGALPASAQTTERTR